MKTGARQVFDSDPPAAEVYLPAGATKRGKNRLISKPLVLAGEMWLRMCSDAVWI